MNASGNGVGVGATVGGGGGGAGLGVSGFEGSGPGQLVSRQAKMAPSRPKSRHRRRKELIAG